MGCTASSYIQKPYKWDPDSCRGSNLLQSADNLIQPGLIEYLDIIVIFSVTFLMFAIHFYHPQMTLRAFTKSFLGCEISQDYCT